MPKKSGGNGKKTKNDAPSSRGNAKKNEDDTPMSLKWTLSEARRLYENFLEMKRKHGKGAGGGA